MSVDRIRRWNVKRIIAFSYRIIVCTWMKMENLKFGTCRSLKFDLKVLRQGTIFFLSSFWALRIKKNCFRWFLFFLTKVTWIKDLCKKRRRGEFEIFNQPRAELRDVRFLSKTQSYLLTENSSDSIDNFQSLGSFRLCADSLFNNLTIGKNVLNLKPFFHHILFPNLAIFLLSEKQQLSEIKNPKEG